MPTRTTRSTTSLNSLRRQSPTSPFKMQAERRKPSGGSETHRKDAKFAKSKSETRSEKAFGSQHRFTSVESTDSPRVYTHKFSPPLLSSSSLPFSSLLFPSSLCPLCLCVSLPPPFPLPPPGKPFGTHPNARKSTDSPRVFEEPLNFLFAQRENSFNPQPAARNLTKPARSPRWGSNRWR